ncbi:MAG: hypothetical protein LBH92_03345 [Bacteroidales bacterium]|nr:hypothetical protein [Bacteroidales bacterium]
MQKTFRKIEKEIKENILAGNDPQEVYDTLSAEYSDTNSDSDYMKRFIRRRIKMTVTPYNRKEFRFSYHLYLIMLIITILITLINKQHRIDALGIFSINSFSSLAAFFSINLFAWIYLFLFIWSFRFNVLVSYWAMFFAGIDFLRLLILLPEQWQETPFFSMLRIIPLLLILIFGSFFAINCTNKYKIEKNSSKVLFYKNKINIPLKLKKEKQNDA